VGGGGGKSVLCRQSASARETLEPQQGEEVNSGTYQKRKSGLIQVLWGEGKTFKGKVRSITRKVNKEEPWSQKGIK